MMRLAGASGKGDADGWMDGWIDGWMGGWVVMQYNGGWVTPGGYTDAVVPAERAAKWGGGGAAGCSQRQLSPGEGCATAFNTGSGLRSWACPRPGRRRW